MHPLTVFFNYLKRINFSLALEREHIDDRQLTDWYPDWMYELMETDEVRTQSYLDAIRATVAGKVVLELGTGRKALLARYCAEAGAKTVYAIEANKGAYESSLARVTSEGTDNIHLICGFSDKVQVPERCDVLVHDLVGDIGSSEGMVPFVADASARFLGPRAVHVPSRCTTLAVLAEDPKLSPAEWALSWVLRELKPFEALSFVRFFGFPHAAALSEPQVFEDILLGEPWAPDAGRKLVFEVKRDGVLRGVLLYIRLQLSETTVIDTWESQTSWSTPYVRLKTNTPVRKGDIVEMDVQSDLSGNPSYGVKLALVAGDASRSIGDYAWSGD